MSRVDCAGRLSFGWSYITEEGVRPTSRIETLMIDSIESGTC